MAHEKLSPEQRAKLNEFYKANFGYDFGALPPERVAAAAAVIEKMRRAQVPFYTQKDGKIGNPERDAINAVGGIDPKEAEAMSVFANWHAGLMPEELDRDRLKKGGVPDSELERIQGERTERWKQDARREFDIFARPPDPQPEQSPAAGTAAAKGEEGAAQPQQQPTPDEEQQKEHRARGIREGNKIRVVRS